MNTQEWNPGQILELSGYYWKTCTLHAGVKLDVFTAIGKERLTAGDVAGKLGVDRRALTMLLNALAAMGLLSKTEEMYSNTPASFAFLSKDSPQYLGFMIMHHHHLVDSWSQLDEAVQTGRPVRGRVSFADEEGRESFLMGMFNLAMTIAPELGKNHRSFRTAAFPRFGWRTGDLCHPFLSEQSSDARDRSMISPPPGHLPKRPSPASA